MTDPYVCHCGDYERFHPWGAEHDFVAMGCDCGRLDEKSCADRKAWRARGIEVSERSPLEVAARDGKVIEYVGDAWRVRKDDEAPAGAVVCFSLIECFEIGTLGWCWWADGNWGSTSSIESAMEAAESRLRARAK